MAASRLAASSGRAMLPSGRIRSRTSVRSRRSTSAREYPAGEADVALDDAEQGLVRPPARVELERRDAQPFGEDFGAVGGVRAGHPSARVGVVADRRRVGDGLALGEDRLEHEDVGQVHAAVIGIVQHQHVALGDIVAEVPQHRLQRHRDGAEMPGQAEPLRRRPSLRVADSGGVIHDVLQHARIGGAVDGGRHSSPGAVRALRNSSAVIGSIDRASQAACRARKLLMGQVRAHARARGG